MRGRRYVLVRLFWLAGLLGLAGAGGAWWYHTTRPAYQLRKGQEALRRGDAEGAERWARTLEAGGYADHVHLLRSEIFLRHHRLGQAVHELNQISEANEEIRLQAGIILGLGFLSLNRLREAEHLLLYVVTRQPDHLNAHRGLAALYFDLGAKGLAVYHTREWVRLAPQDGYAHRFLGSIYSDFGDSNAWAIREFQEALRHPMSAPIVEKVKQELAELLVRQTDYTQALQVLGDLDPSASDGPKAVELRAECLWGLGQTAELRALLDRELVNFPSSVPLVRLHAQLLLGADRPKEAAASLEQALRINRQEHSLRYLLAQVYERVGRPADAAEQRRISQTIQNLLSEMSDLSTKAMEKPWDAPLRGRLAEICEILDKPDEAAMWRKAAAACPQNPNAANMAPETAGNDARPK
jgi:predicted Zn-dependent protease